MRIGIALAIGLTAIAAAMPARAQRPSACPAGSRGESGLIGDVVDGRDLRSPYRICVPARFNGLLISDLDMVVTGTGVDTSSVKTKLLAQGYAVSGIGRAPWRADHWDPMREADYLLRVIDRFGRHYGKPRRVVEYGCSGGGNVALLMAEYHARRIDGAIATGAYTPIQMQNQWLDALFALKALIAPGSALPVIRSEAAAADGAAWRAVLDAAQRTPEGRARIALAATLSQYPTRGGGGDDAAQQAMYDTLRGQVEFFLKTRPLFANAAGGNPSWNLGVDHAAFFANGYPDQKALVARLYAAAHLSIAEDLARIDRTPRIAADPAAAAFWHRWPRDHDARPAVPVLRANTIGDPSSSIAALAAYRSRAPSPDLYRDVAIDAAGHCTQNDAEILAMIAAMRHRLETGRWDDAATPAALDRAAAALGQETPRFVAPVLPIAYNRAFWPGSKVPAASDQR